MQVHCPNCKHSFETGEPKKGVRACCLCKQNIGKHDKWFFNADSRIQHRHCDYPENYTHPTEINIINNKEYANNL